MIRDRDPRCARWVEIVPESERVTAYACVRLGFLGVMCCDVATVRFTPGDARRAGQALFDAADAATKEPQ